MTARSGRRSRSAALLGVWALAVLFALIARRELEPPVEPGPAWLLYVGDGALALWVAWRRPDQDLEQVLPRRTGLPTGRRRRASAALLVLLSLALSGAAFHLVRRGDVGTPTVLVWLGALTALALAAAVAEGLNRPRRPRRLLTPECALVVAVLGLALVVRLTDLTGFPPNVHGDEALIGLDARGFLTGDNDNVFTVGFAATPRLSYAIPALSMDVFGDNLFGLRMASVLLGVASVLLTYLLTRHLFGSRTAFVAAMLLALAEWHVHFSRSGISNMQAAVVTLLVLLFVVRASDGDRWLDWVFAGFSIGLSLEVYQAARLAPVVAAAYVLYRCIRERGFLRTRWRGFVVAGIGALALVAPIAGYFWDHRHALSEHSREVWIFSPAPRAHSLSQYGVDSMVGVVIEQSKRLLAALNGAVDTYPQYNGPLTDGLAGPLVVVGLLVVIALAVRDSRHFVLALWLVLTLLVGVLTINAVFSARLVAVIPAFAIAAATVIELGWVAAEQAFGRSGARAFALFACVVLGAVGYANYRAYFDRYPDSHPPDEPTTLARYARAINDDYRIYLLPGGSTPLGFETIRFLAPSLDGRELPSWDRSVLESVRSDKGAAFVAPFEPPDGSAALRSIEATFPTARRSRLGTDRFTYFEVLLVDRVSLERSQRAAPS